MRPVLSLVILALAVGNAAAEASPVDGSATRMLLAEDLSAGRIDRETWLLQSFRYVFAPERLDPRYAPQEYAPLRCFTPEVAEYQRLRPTLTASATAEIDGYLAPRGASLRSTYVSPGGHFELTFLTSGPDAVPATDTNPANGIPDLVERCAEYMDYSWSQEIDTIGFIAPALPDDGTYDVSFQAMSGTFSYTIIVSATITEIFLHSTFFGYPPNTDPDGNQLGSAKVACAHEFKHASQYTTSSWSEGGWTELDATWAEEIVYPATNKYWNYVNNDGPNILGQPWTSLDAGGTGSYEDCLWEHHLSGAFGNVLLVDLWNTVRANHRSDTMKKSYQDVLVMHGSSWDQTYPNFLDWAWFTGSRALPPYGFPDAPNLMRMNLRGAAVALYPFAVTDSVAALAAHPRRFNPGIGMPRIIFDGSDSTTSWTVSVITKEPSGSFTIVHPVLDGTNACNYQVPMLWSSLQYVGVIVTNAKRLPPAQPYTLEVLDEKTGDAPSVGAIARLITQLPPTPNPTKGSTLLRFALPSAARASVRIYDVSGRIVRTLVDAPMPAGPGQVTWDGCDASAAPVAAGVYWSRVESRDTSATQKVTILR